MRPHIIFRYAGFVLLFNAGFLLLSALVSAIETDASFFPLLYSAMVTALFGLFPLIFVPPTRDITNKEGFFIVVASWLLSCLSGLLPYAMWGGEFTLTNAWFESVSGFTTTGSTILNNIEALPKGLLFWRSATHWIGGSGIIIFTLSVLPSMGKAGMTLYRTEMSPLATDNFHYRTQRAIRILIFVYVGLTILQSLLLFFFGMNVFDAVTHAFGTIATGGFSTKNLSVAYFRSLPLETIIMVFMILSGIHFGLLYGVATGNVRGFLRSTPVRFYLATMFVGTVLTAWSIHGVHYNTWGESLRYASFQVISLGTSTGFATADSSVWPSFAQLLMIFFTLQCACAGSTSGGIKVDRVVIFFKALARRIKEIQHPHAVIAVRVNGEVVSEDTVNPCVLYIALYIGIVFFSSLLLTAMGVDTLSAFSGPAAAMGNVGPGFGVVGSMGNFSTIPDPGKWVLATDMLLGRLEIFGLILFFAARSWK